VSLYSIIEAPYNIVPSWGLPPTEDNANPASHAHIKCREGKTLERDMLQSTRLHEFCAMDDLLPRIKRLCCELRQLKQHGYG